MYYECHITMGDCDTIQNPMQKVVEGAGWSYSSIFRDPDLGKDLFHYATKHYPASRTIEFVKEQMFDVALRLHTRGYTVLRQKIELVIFDTKKEGHGKEDLPSG